MNWRIFWILPLLFSSSLAVASKSISLWSLQKTTYLHTNINPIIQKNWLLGRSIRPNELNLADYSHVWTRIPQISQSAYISIGSERAFIGAGLSQAGYLIGLDFDPFVVKYNRINTIFLALSKSPEDYVYLRLKAPHHEILKRLSTHHLDFYISKNQWSWWHQIQKQNDLSTLFSPLSSDTREVAEFKKMGYWNNYSAWSHLNELAKSGRMGFFNIDLGSRSSVQDFLKLLKPLKLQISALDLSNLSDYIGLKAMANLVSTLIRAQPSRPLRLITTHIQAHPQTMGFSWVFQAQDFQDKNISEADILKKLSLSLDKPAAISCQRTHLPPL